MGVPNQDTGRFLSDLPFFSGLPKADLQAFLDGSTLRTHPKGEIIFNQGDKAARFYVVQTGWVGISRLCTNTNESAIISLFTRGDIFGEAAVFGGTEYPFGAVAAEDVQLIEIPAAILKKRAKANPLLMERIVRSMARGLQKLEIESDCNDLLTAAQRVGCLLLQLSAGMIEAETSVVVSCNMPNAATRLGMCEETFSRALAQLSSVGVKNSGANVTVENLRVLSDYIGIVAARVMAAEIDQPAPVSKVATA